MFEKLLANLPYNPGLQKQFGYFLRRLRHEESVRRSALLLLGLAFILQLAVAIHPPRSAAVSSNASNTAPVSNGLGKRIVVSNVTQRLDDATSAPTQAGDTLTYTLFAANHEPTAETSFVMRSNFDDVLHHAAVVDLHGGQLANGIVSWPAATIAARNTLTHSLTVRLSDQRPAGLRMAVYYGNAATVDLPSSSLRQLPRAIAPADNRLSLATSKSIALVALLLVISAYFYSRSRLLVNESVITMHEKRGRVQ